MGNPTRIDVANKNFDQLYEDLQPQLEKMSGKTCYARYDANRGLRIKSGIDNFLRLNKIMDARGKKFADATDIFKDAINRQYPGQMVGEKTLGEHLLQSVMKDIGDGDRISAPEIKALYEELHAYADKHNLDASAPNPAALSTVASSRVVQSDASIKAGKAFLKEAVAKDLLATHPHYQGKPARALARADQILSRVDMRNGLTMSSYNAVADEMAKSHPSVVRLSNTRNLLDLLDIRSKINIASRQLRRLNEALPAFSRHFSAEKRDALDEALSERRAILQDLGNLSFPDDLNNLDKISELAARLEQNCSQMNDAMEEMDRSGFPDRENAFLHRLEQQMETLGLAAALRDYAEDIGDADGSVSFHDILSTHDFDDSLDALSNARVIVPKTLWTAPTRQANDTFSDVAKSYYERLRESQDMWHKVFNNAPEATLDLVEAGLRYALTLNDAMLEGFERTVAVRGGRAFSETIAKDSLVDTKDQRVKLNLQLAYVRQLMQQDPQRARSVTPPPRSYSGAAPSDDAVSEQTTPETLGSKKGDNVPVLENLETEYKGDASVQDNAGLNHEPSMTVRRVPLERSYGDIPEAHLNTLSQADNNAPRRVVIEDPTKRRAGRFATSGQSMFAHQSPDTADDGRARIKDILDEAAPSRAGGLKNPHDASMSVASAPTSPRNPLQSPAAGAAQTTADVSLLNLDSVPASGPNPEDSSMNIQSVPPSPDHQPASSDTVPTSGANPEDSSMSIRSVSNSPAHQLEAASPDEFASIDGANAGAETDVDLYGAEYDASNGDRVNKESSSDTGSDDEEDDSVQLP